MLPLCLKLRLMKTTLKRFGSVLVLTSVTFFPAGAQEAATTLSGVFTQAQVDRGKEVFRQSCEEGCHGKNLLGDKQAKPLIGDSFKERWRGKNLAEMYAFLSMNMPDDLPGVLKPEEYFSAMIYVLSRNDFPAGDKALSDDPAALAAIVFADK